jgi:hypothetical protein
MRIADITLLTNCTSRKRRPAMPALMARALPKGDLIATSEEWVSRLEVAKYQFVASHLYCGRAVTETLKAGESVGAEVAFLSAGLGIVQQYQEVPSYSLVATPGYPDSVCERITGKYDSASWWGALAKAQGIERPLARFIEGRRSLLTLVAMPCSYLGMVAQDLADLPANTLRTVRIIGPRRREEIDARLQDNWLPYDARLDSPDTGLNGTASDFPHRALGHFVSNILPLNTGKSSQCHADAVENALSKFEAYVRPRGQNTSDDDVISAISTVWKKHSGRRASILRELRSELNIACEQSRFRKLADKVEDKLNALS